MQKIIASIQVRMGSIRLPGKVMRLINNRPLLGILVDRLKQVEHLDGIVIATSINSENNVIEDFCNAEGIDIYRGSEDDVLGRTLNALNQFNATIGVEIFGDCPLIDPRIVDFMISNFLNDSSDLDFLGNDIKTTFPPGMDVEVFKVSALQDSAGQTNDPYLRENGTLYIRQNSEKYKVKNLEAPINWHRPDLSMEVDTAEDFIVVEAIIQNFDNLYFSLEDIISFLDDNPEIKNLNNHIHRRWKEHRNDEI
jgi:spore coat polysaccharide biosynthesis protein SpsF